MVAVFKSDSTDEKIKITPLFLNEDTCVGQTSLEHVFNAITGVMTEEQREKIKIFRLYVGNYKWNDDCRKKLKLLCRLDKNEIPVAVLRISPDYLSAEKMVLNEEAKFLKSEYSYEVYEFPGELSYR